MSSTTDDEPTGETLPRGRHHLERIVRGGAPPDLQSSHQLRVVPDEEPRQAAHHHSLSHPLLAFLPREAVTAEAGGGVWQTLPAVLAATNISPAAELVELLVPDSLSISPPRHVVTVN